MTARPIDGAEGYEFYKRHDGRVELDEINEYLRGIGMREVKPRMLRHYRKLERNGYESYVTQNRLDIAVAGEYAWTEDMRARYSELRREFDGQLIYEMGLHDVTIERLGPASAAIRVEKIPRAGSSVVLRLVQSGIELVGTVVRTDRQSKRVHLSFDPYTSLPVAPEQSPHHVRFRFDLEEEAESVVAVTDLLLRFERFLKRAAPRTDEVPRISQMSLASPLEVLLAGGQSLLTAGAVLLPITLARKYWYEGTREKYEAEGIQIDNAKKRRKAQLEADGDLVRAAEKDLDRDETEVLDTIRPEGVDTGLTRRELFQVLLAGVELPVEAEVEVVDVEVADEG